MKSSKMYKDGPTMKKDEDGKPTVSKTETKAEKASDRTQEGMDGVKMEEKGDGMPIHGRHAMERRSLHHQHETEHAVHGDHDKKEMHARHEAAMKSLHGKHEKEMGETGKEAGGSGKKEIEKIEK